MGRASASSSEKFRTWEKTSWLIRNLNLHLHLLMLQTLFMPQQKIFYICPVNITALNAFFGLCSEFHYPV